MAIVNIDENSKKGQIILELIKEMGVEKVIDDHTMKAMKDAEKDHNLIKCENFDDYLKKTK